MRAALSGTPLPEGWPAEIGRGAAAVFPVAAGDLPGLRGPELGARLAELERRWIESDFAATRAELLGRR